MTSTVTAHMKPIQRILLATDFSDCSAAAAAFAAQLARQLKTGVDVVTVVDTSPLNEAYGDAAFRGADPAAHDGHQRESHGDVAPERSVSQGDRDSELDQRVDHDRDADRGGGPAPRVVLRPARKGDGHCIDINE